MVADQPAGEADQDRGQGPAPRPLRRLPDGRGRGAERTVRQNTATDRWAATTASRAASPSCGPRVGFIVTNLSRPVERVVAFYNKRGTCEQWIKEGKNAIKWTRLSCCSFAANAVRLQLHALAYNLANFMRTLALPEAVAQWSLTSLREKLIKIGAKVVRHARYAVFQMAEVAVPRELFEQILRLIDGLRPRPAQA